MLFHVVSTILLKAIYQSMIFASQICQFCITRNRSKIVNNEKSPKYLIFTSEEKDTIQNVYNYVLYQTGCFLPGTKLI